MFGILLSALFLWIPLSLVVGSVGSKRQIGFWPAFFISFFFSPLIGLIVVLLSKSIQSQVYEQQVLTLQRQQQKALQELSKPKPTFSATELLSLKALKDAGDLTEEEYQRLKNQMMGTVVNEAIMDFDTSVAGFQHYAGPTLTHKLKPTQELLLERDPRNEHDGNAIKIFLERQPIGHVPSEIAALVAPEMDKGRKFYSSILSYDRHEIDFRKVKIRIWQDY